MPMVMAGVVPKVVVLAFGAGALGGTDALRLLLASAGRSPVVDIAACILVMGMATTQLLGAVLLAHFVRKARTGAGAVAGRGAPATDLVAQMTLVVSLGVGFLVAACLLVASGDLGSVRLLVDFAGESPVLAALVIGTAAVAAGSLPRTMPLLRIFREPWNARGGAPTERATTSQAVHFVGLLFFVVVCAVLAIRSVAHRGLDKLHLSPGFTYMFVAVATATLAGTVLHIRFSRMARNAAVGAAPTPAADTRRFGKLTYVAVFVFTLACLLACRPAYA